MSGDSRKIEKREFTQIATDVRSANAHAMRFDEREAFAGLFRAIDLDATKCFRFGNLNCAHFVCGSIEQMIRAVPVSMLLDCTTKTGIMLGSLGERQIAGSLPEA